MTEYRTKQTLHSDYIKKTLLLEIAKTCSLIDNNQTKMYDKLWSQNHSSHYGFNCNLIHWDKTRRQIVNEHERTWRSRFYSVIANEYEPMCGLKFHHQLKTCFIQFYKELSVNGLKFHHQWSLLYGLFLFVQKNSLPLHWSLPSVSFTGQYFNS